MTNLSALVEWDWVYGPHDDHEFLHALTEYDPPSDGLTACGVRGRFEIPGMFSRMGSPRCDACCDAFGYPRGVGSPKNDDAVRPLVEARLKAGAS